MTTPSGGWSSAAPRVRSPDVTGRGVHCVRLSVLIPLPRTRPRTYTNEFFSLATGVECSTLVFKTSGQVSQRQPWAGWHPHWLLTQLKQGPRRVRHINCDADERVLGRRIQQAHRSRPRVVLHPRLLFRGRLSERGGGSPSGVLGVLVGIDTFSTMPETIRATPSSAGSRTDDLTRGRGTRALRGAESLGSNAATASHLYPTRHEPRPGSLCRLPKKDARLTTGAVSRRSGCASFCIPSNLAARLVARRPRGRAATMRD